MAHGAAWFRPVRGREAAVDAAAVCGLLLLAVAEILLTQGQFSVRPHLAVALVAASVMCLALWWRRSHPLVPVIVALAGVSAGAAVGITPQAWLLPLLCLVAYSAGAYARGWESATGLCGSVLAGWVVAVESLVPAALSGCTIEEFLERLSEFDARMLERLTTARRNGKVLRYVGSIDAEGRAQIGLVELPATHPFANIALTDNIVRFQTARYDRNPLIVQGPGAGPAVTAAGVFADLLRICAYLGAKL